MNTLNLKPARAPYLVNSDATIAEALDSLQKTKGLPLAIVNTQDVVEGTLSNGDIIRFFSNNSSASLENGIMDVCNTSPSLGHVTDPAETIQQYLSSPDIKMLPIVDRQRVVKKLAFLGAPSISIGDHIVFDNKSPFILAEIGVNHQGDMDIAKELISAAKESGCDGVKFQHRSSTLYSKDSVDKYDLGTQYILSEIKRTSLTTENMIELCEYSKSLGLSVVVTPFDLDALEDTQRMNIDALKIASCDLSNYELITACISTQYPMILSTGMSYERQIIKTAQLLEENLVEHAFLHCNSTYPAPVEDINLSYIQRLSKLVSCPVGYSSHDSDVSVPLASIAAGASIVEFHITRSKNDAGTDHRASIEISDLTGFVKSARIISTAIGSNKPRTPSQGELANKLSLGKSWGAAKDLELNHKLSRADLRLISPGSGYSSDQLDELLGKNLLRPINNGELIEFDHVNAMVDKSKIMESIKLKLDEAKYISGIPVRYHDFEELSGIFQLPMYEFHMSDRDLDIDPNKYLSGTYSSELIVHAVEQFEDGFIFDLCSDSSEVVERSKKELERLVRATERLVKYFPATQRVPVVLNIGGFTQDEFLSDEESSEKCKLAAERLKEASEKYPNCRFLPQTMPPFPWHQGGKSYHNILTSKNKISQFVDLYGSDICFDVSHTALSCEYYGEDLYEIAEMLNDKTFHLHLSDAKGSNAEGLAIGDGDINMFRLHQSMFANAERREKMFMIPEIWQGHLKKGEGFLTSLSRYAETLSFGEKDNLST